MKSNLTLLGIILMVTCLTQLATDIYIPSLVNIANWFDSPIGLVQFSVSVYLYGVAFAQLFYGPLSEGIGRKTPLLIGLVIMLAGNIVCIFAPNAETLVLGRFIQGCGAGACACLWRSIFRDTFVGENLSIYGGYLSIFITFIVPAAPLLGGVLQHYFNWQAAFVFMFIYTVISLFSVVFIFKETHTSYHKDKLQFNYIIESFHSILSNKNFLGVTFCTFMIYGTIFAWLTAGPVLLIKYVKISPIAFGWFNFLGCGIAYGIAGKLNKKLVLRYGMYQTMRMGITLSLIAGGLLMFNTYIFGLGFLSIAIPIVLLYFGSSFVWPNAFAIAFTPFGHIAGYASSIYSFMQLAGGAIISTIMSKLPTTNATPLALMIIIATLTALVIQKILVKLER